MFDFRKLSYTFDVLKKKKSYTGSFSYGGVQFLLNKTNYNGIFSLKFENRSL